jgi:hypothetical protein
VIGTPTSASYTDTGLSVSTTYYYKVSAINSGGESGQSGYTSATTPASTILTSGTLAERLTWLASNAVDGGEYTIELHQNESIAPSTLSYSGKSVKITLKGDTTERTVSLSSNGVMFIVGSGVTLTLEDKVTLAGRSNGNRLVSVSGTLVMNAGSKIKNNSSGSGVNINSTGTFTMAGGTISENTASGMGGVSGGGVQVSGTFTMEGGTISGNTTSAWGGGVYVIGGTFTMKGGTISGNTASFNGYSGGGGGGVWVAGTGTFKKVPPTGGDTNSGIIYGSEATGTDADGKPLKNTATNGGDAVYNVLKKRNTTAGQTDQIDTATGKGLSTSGEAPFGE